MKRILLIVIAVLMACVVPEKMSGEPRRTSSAVRRERARAARERAATQRRLDENMARTERSLRRLERLEAEIEINSVRERGLSRRVDSIEARAAELTDSVGILTERVGRLDRSYCNSLRAIRRQRNSASPAAFVFSAQSFAQAVRRIRYLKDLAEWNVEQGRRLREDRERLSSSVMRLDSARTRLAAARDALRRSRSEMEADRRSVSGLVDSLRSHAGELERVLERQRRQAQALEDELNRAIEAEEAERRAAEEAERRAAEEAERRADGTSGGRDTVEVRREETTEQQPRPVRDRSAAELTQAFAAARGHLPMPVDGKATIVSNFGRRTHAEFSRVEIQNNGIDIEARPGSHARAVFEGTVTMVIVMEGFQNVVLVRHGEYLTVYAGLSSLSVRKGDHVGAGQKLGTVHTVDDEHGTRLHFEVRHEKEKLDPRQWLDV